MNYVMSVYMYLCPCVWSHFTSVFVCTFMCLCVWSSLYILSGFVSLLLYVCTSTCMSVCACRCTHVPMHVCAYVCIIGNHSFPLYSDSYDLKLEWARLISSSRQPTPVNLTLRIQSTTHHYKGMWEPVAWWLLQERKNHKSSSCIYPQHLLLQYFPFDLWCIVTCNRISGKSSAEFIMYVMQRLCVCAGVTDSNPCFMVMLLTMHSYSCKNRYYWVNSTSFIHQTHQS